MPKQWRDPGITRSVGESQAARPQLHDNIHSTGLVDLHAMCGATWHVLLVRKGAARVSIHLLPDPASIDEMLQ